MDKGFIWNEDKYHQVRRQHNVQFYEVVAALEDANGYEEPDPQGHKDRQMWIGITPGGRVLSIIFTTEEDSQILRLITAFKAEERFVVEYYNTRRGI
jgi:uncharacterized DUF497 family protein